MSSGPLGWNARGRKAIPLVWTSHCCAVSSRVADKTGNYACSWASGKAGIRAGPGNAPGVPLRRSSPVYPILLLRPAFGEGGLS